MSPSPAWNADAALGMGARHTGSPPPGAMRVVIPVFSISYTSTTFRVPPEAGAKMMTCRPRSRSGVPALAVS